MKFAILGLVFCVLCGCQNAQSYAPPGVSVLKSAEKYAVVTGKYQGPMTIGGNEYSRATRGEAMQIAVENDIFANLKEAESAFENQSYDFVYAVISEAVAIKDVYASAGELRTDIFAGLSGPQLKRKYAPSFRLTVVAPER